MTVVRIIEKSNLWVARGMAVLMVPLLCLTLYGVIMRYLFNSPPIWGPQFLLFIWVPAATLAGGYVLSIKGHVKLDLLYSRWSPRGQAISDAITFPAFLLFVVVLTVTAIDAAWRSTITNELHMYWAWHGPVYPKRIAIAVGAILLLAAGIAMFIRNIRTILGKEDAGANTKSPK